MKFFYLDFPKPILVIDEFLPTEAAAAVLQEAIDLKPIYKPATVINDKGNAEPNPSFRENDVVYIDEVFRDNDANSKIVCNLVNHGRVPFKDKPTCGLWSPESRELWGKDSTIFDIINLSTRREIILSRYGNCDFYGMHRDANQNAANRLVTVVYYVNKEPEKFTGGDITFKHEDKEVSVKPMHNRAVVFQSNILHRVQKVRIDGDAFENGRFSLNIWLGFQN